MRQCQGPPNANHPIKNIAGNSALPAIAVDTAPSRGAQESTCGNSALNTAIAARVASAAGSSGRMRRRLRITSGATPITAPSETEPVAASGAPQPMRDDVLQEAIRGRCREGEEDGPASEADRGHPRADHRGENDEDGRDRPSLPRTLAEETAKAMANNGYVMKSTATSATGSDCSATT